MIQYLNKELNEARKGGHGTFGAATMKPSIPTSFKPSYTTLEQVLILLLSTNRFLVQNIQLPLIIKVVNINLNMLKLIMRVGLLVLKRNPLIWVCPLSKIMVKQ